MFAGVAVYENLDGKTLEEAAAQLNLTPPYALLMLAKAEHKVEIFADPQTLKLFDKEKILSPYPIQLFYQHYLDLHTGLQNLSSTYPLLLD